MPEFHMPLQFSGLTSHSQHNWSLQQQLPTSLLEGSLLALQWWDFHAVWTKNKNICYFAHYLQHIPSLVPYLSFHIRFNWGRYAVLLEEEALPTE